MGDTNVERDAKQQRQFGQTLCDFENDMRTATKNMRGHIQEAYGSIQADNAREALDYIIKLLDAIDASLPGVEEFGTRQKVLAGYIEEAEGKKFSRR